MSPVVGLLQHIMVLFVQFFLIKTTKIARIFGAFSLQEDLAQNHHHNTIFYISTTTFVENHFLKETAFPRFFNLFEPCERSELLMFISNLGAKIQFQNKLKTKFLKTCKPRKPHKPRKSRKPRRPRKSRNYRKSLKSSQITQSLTNYANIASIANHAIIANYANPHKSRNPTQITQTWQISQITQISLCLFICT